MHARFEPGPTNTNKKRLSNRVAEEALGSC
jgi:hypothetical protein